MKQYIDKSAVVAEIENLLDKNTYLDVYECAYRDGNNGALYVLKGKLDIFKVKEVDLEKELDFNAEVSKFIDTFYKNTKIGHKLMIRRTAKHFYELGLKANR